MTDGARVVRVRDFPRWVGVYSHVLRKLACGLVTTDLKWPV